MTEREKMLTGEYYNSWDEGLVADRVRAKQILRKFNQSDPADTAMRRELLQELFQSTHDAWIEAPFYCDYGYNIHTGKNFYANFNCIILDVNRVIIGDNVKFGPYVQVYSATHPTDVADRISGKEMGYEIKIGDNVWIGGGSVICPGVTIGRDTTIGAGSVVFRDIPSGVVAAGNPCKVLKKL